MIWLLLLIAVLVLFVAGAARRYKRHGGARSVDHMTIDSEHKADPGYNPGFGGQ